jgi:hypothetical protein
MKLILEFNSDEFLTRVKKTQEWFGRDAELVGHIIAIFHFMISAVLLTLVIISHTIYTSIWLKIGVFVCLLLIWLQHVIFDVCVVTVWEKNFTKGSVTPFHKILRDVFRIFNITLEDYDTYLIIIESTAVGCFFLEILSYLSDYIQSY